MDMMRNHGIDVDAAFASGALSVESMSPRMCPPIGRVGFPKNTSGSAST